ASASVKGFGLTLALGIFCDLAMMLLFKAPIIRLLAPRAIEKNPDFWDVRDCQNAVEVYNGSYTAALEDGTLDEYPEADQTDADAPRATALFDAATVAAGKIKGRFIKRDINFMGYRKILLIIAAVCVVLSFAVVGIRGLNFGIEFIGGTSTTFSSTGDVTIEQVREAFEAAGEPDAVIQTTSTNGEEGFLVRTTTTSAEDAAITANKVASTFGWSTDNFEVTTIGPDWGASVVRSSLIAFFVSLILIIIYIGIRFEFKMGVIAVITLLHDLIIVIGIYALVGREVNPNTIAALLTILGYSLYDTVVVFHRINDNMMGDSPKVTFISMANHSINQVFLRTINTTLTSFFPVLLMLIFGGETLKDFAFAMAIGLICGSYSSIAIATPLFSWWKEREPKFKKLRRKYGDDITIFQYDRPLCGAMELKALPAAAQAEGSDISVDAGDASGVTAISAKEQSDAPRGGNANQPRKTKNKSTHGQKKVKRPVKPK
ncbi:MAG: protein translocase subunit SecF, partial [Eggerthellaceae bacterium]|nr:protein translocase subunit SecF [Eggerthellaceae bacterium]